MRPGDAAAGRLIPTSQRNTLQAFDYDVPLRVVSLAGTVPAEWTEDFKSALAVRCILNSCAVKRAILFSAPIHPKLDFALRPVHLAGGVLLTGWKITVTPPLYRSVHPRIVI
jgi:hypothetical protein